MGAVTPAVDRKKQRCDMKQSEDFPTKELARQLKARLKVEQETGIAMFLVRHGVEVIQV